MEEFEAAGRKNTFMQGKSPNESAHPPCPPPPRAAECANSLVLAYLPGHPLGGIAGPGTLIWPIRKR